MANENDLVARCMAACPNCKPVEGQLTMSGPTVPRVIGGKYVHDLDGDGKNLVDCAAAHLLAPIDPPKA